MTQKETTSLCYFEKNTTFAEFFPETHCRIEPIANSQQPTAFKAYIDPIAGTTKRTGDAEADRKGAEYYPLCW